MKVAIIAGHRSDTAGKRTPPFVKPVDIDGDGTYDVLVGEQYREHYANVGVASKLDTALRRCCFETYKGGWDDEDATNDTLNDDNAGLTKRQALVRAAWCDISVAVHFNAFGNGMSFNSATGVCTYIHINPGRVGDSAALAALVQARLIEGTPQTNRGVHADAFAEVNCAAMGTKASVLVELAFMTNWEEASKLMANEAFWLEAAEEICRAICEYVGVAYIEEDNVKTKNITAKMNGIEAALTSIEFNGENYIRIRDLADAQTDDKLTVAWDEAAQTVVINSK